MMNMKFTISFKRVTLFALLTFIGIASCPTFAQDSRDKSERMQIDRRLSDLKVQLDECRKGKRSEAEKYVILKRVLRTYGMLRQSDSADAKAVKKEWDELLKNHPEYVANPPTELKEETELRKKQDAEAKGIKEKAGKFVPNDARVAGLYGADNKIMAQYQYRVDFFKLPKGTVVGGKKNNIKILRGNSEVSVSDMKPHKTLSFKSRIGVSPILPRTFSHPLWLCSDLLQGYSPNTDEEYKILEVKGHGSAGMPWINSSGEYEDFCGVVSLDGEIIYRLPIAQHFPDKLLRVLEVSNEGKKAVIIMGEKMSYTQEDSDSYMVGNPKQVYVWEYPDKLNNYAANDSSEEIQAVLSRWGLGKK